VPPEKKKSLIPSGAGGMAQMIKHLPSKFKALISNISTASIYTIK
jgi:hypothetical protein